MEGAKVPGPYADINEVLVILCNLVRMVMRWHSCKVTKCCGLSQTMRTTTKVLQVARHYIIAWTVTIYCGRQW